MRKEYIKISDVSENDSKDSSYFTSIINLCNTTVGSSCLSIPFAINQSGLLFGIILLIISCICVKYSLYFIIKAKDATDKKDYEDIAVYIL